MVLSEHHDEIQRRILRAISELTRIHGYPPSYREIGEEVGLAHSAVHGYVQELREAKLVNGGTSNIARTVALTAAGRKRIR